MGRSHATSFDFAADTFDYLQTGVARSTRGEQALAGGVLAQIEHENETLSVRHTRDAAGRVTGFDDQAGVHYDYRYDALGRLRSVLLPDGSSHRIDFDDYGRDSRVVRDGIGALEHVYDPVTGWLTDTTYYGKDGQPQRTTHFDHDAIGRKTSERHYDLVSGGQQSFTWYYDGATPTAPTTRTTLGLTTAVTGDGYAKLFFYRPDGKLQRSIVELDGWRTIETELDYADDQSVRGHTTTLRRADGAVLSSSHLDSRYDGFGRVAGLTLDGAEIATLAYDGDGLLASAALAGGSSVTFSHDPLTRATLGFGQQTPGWLTENTIRFNERGLLDGEVLSSGGQSVTRSYGYSKRAFLTSSIDAQASCQYDYDALGLPTRVVDSKGDRTLTASPGLLTAGASQYRFDALGRTIAHDDLEVTYGPDGQLASARRGAQAWAFRSDEQGHRLLKETNGQPVAAYLDGTYIDASGIVEPLAIGGTPVAVLQNGALRVVPLDRRGTLLGDSDGTAHFPSPYGDRETHPDLSPAIDYVTKGYDADLGVIRMGVRDYDPAISRFWTPDPLFLAKPEKCLESPVECNLYGYVRSNPTNATDPDGRQGVEFDPSGGHHFVPNTITNLLLKGKQIPKRLRKYSGTIQRVGARESSLTGGASHMTSIIRQY